MPAASMPRSDSWAIHTGIRRARSARLNAKLSGQPATLILHVLIIVRTGRLCVCWLIESLGQPGRTAEAIDRRAASPSPDWLLDVLLHQPRLAS